MSSLLHYPAIRCFSYHYFWDCFSFVCALFSSFYPGACLLHQLRHPVVSFLTSISPTCSPAYNAPLQLGRHISEHVRVAPCYKRTVHRVRDRASQVLGRSGGEPPFRKSLSSSPSGSFLISSVSPPLRVHHVLGHCSAGRTASARRRTSVKLRAALGSQTSRARGARPRRLDEHTSVCQFLTVHSAVFMCTLGC